MLKFIADLHIHSRFSRATSRDLDPEHLAFWARKKGIKVVGTGDFTHPGWIAELQDKLIQAEQGLYGLRPELEKAIKRELPPSDEDSPRFLLSAEISCIYKKNDKTRKLHHLILLPDFEAVLKFNRKLEQIGNIRSDGRPILGLDSRNLLEIVLETSDKSFFIPAHVWTPWFSLFGSKSGFDDIEECFEDLTPHIHALETGLSSDPPMNRLLSKLDQYLLVSNSDAHSPAKLGREANLFETELNYDSMIRAMTNGQGFLGTIEFFPEEGKYHLDGHRKCEVRFHPRETKDHQGLCPVCGKPLTIGVLHRVDDLADRDEPERSKDFYSLIPLSEILSEIYACGPGTKKVTQVYETLINTLGPELHILLDSHLERIESAGGILLARAIDRMRGGRVICQEGYDGEYGVIRLFQEKEKAELLGQGTLFQTEERKEDKRKDFKREKKIAPNKKASGEQARLALSDNILDPLNPAQREAVLHDKGHLLIVAGPGTGKTMTLTHRMAHLLRERQAGEGVFLALTFTNKAAREMKERLDRLVGEAAGTRVCVSTFHGFCLSVLRNDGTILGLPDPFSLCSEMDTLVLAEEAAVQSGQRKSITGRFIKKLPDFKFSSVPGHNLDTETDDLFPVFKYYQERLRKLSLLDFDDLEVETLRLFIRQPDICQKYARQFPYIFVDEYQDTNRVQAEILKRIVHALNEPSGKTPVSENSTPYSVRLAPCALHLKPCVFICAIGDPNQAIYGFRGADISNFYRFQDDFPGATSLALSENYRSTQKILDLSAEVAGELKPLHGVCGLGDSVCLTNCRTHSEEAEMIIEQIEKLMGGTTYFSLDSERVESHEDGVDIGFGDMAVLFRLNSLGEALEEAFSRAGIPFVRSGEKPLIGQYPANLFWRLLQSINQPENDYYRTCYFNLLRPGDKGEEILKRMSGENEPCLTDLIDQAAALHAIDLNTEATVSVLNRIKQIAGNYGNNLATFIDVLSLDRGIDHHNLRGDRVSLTSIHAAKGLEWSVVFIIGCEDQLLPCTLFGERDEEEERRLLYVGLTRARQRLILSHASRRILNGRPLQMKISPFLAQVSSKHLVPLKRSGWKRKPRGPEQLSLFLDL